MNNIPTSEELITTLNTAGSAHHEYEQTYLQGVRDEQWAGFYAAYVLGRLGDFAQPSALTRWLIETPTAAGTWAESAASHLLAKLNN